MPDLITHSAAAYFISRFKWRAQDRALFYLGAILPDLLSRGVYIAAPNLYYATDLLHSPFCVTLFTLIFIEFFDRSIKKRVFLLLISGVVSHYLLDILQKHLAIGYYWFFPFSWKTYTWGLFWPETATRFSFVWITLILFLEITIQIKNKFNCD